MSHNLCSLLPEQQERVEGRKGGRLCGLEGTEPEIKTPAESEAGNYKGEMQTYFLRQVEEYRKVKS